MLGTEHPKCLEIKNVTESTPRIVVTLHADNANGNETELKVTAEELPGKFLSLGGALVPGSRKSRADLVEVDRQFYVGGGKHPV